MLDTYYVLGMRWEWRSGPPDEKIITKSSQFGEDNMQLVKEVAFEMGFEGRVGVQEADVVRESMRIEVKAKTCEWAR